MDKSIDMVVRKVVFCKGGRMQSGRIVSGVLRERGRLRSEVVVWVMSWTLVFFGGGRVDKLPYSIRFGKQLG